MLVGTYLAPACPLMHPAFVYTWRRDPFIARVWPLLEITPHDVGATFHMTLLLLRLVAAGAPPVHNWQLIVRMLRMQYMFSGETAHAVTQAVISSLLDEGATCAIGRQLQQGQQGSRWGAWLPSVEKLRITALIMACSSLFEDRSSPAEQGAIWQQEEAWARQLMREQPSHPRSHRLLASATVGIGCVSPHTLDAERCGLVALVAQHFRRGLALAREQCSDVWTAAVSYDLAMFGMTSGAAAVTPAEVEELWREGRAARQRCKACLPQAWMIEVNDMHQCMKSMQPALDEHLRLSPGRWGGAGLATMRRDGVEAAFSQADTRFNEGVYACDGCGQSSLALKRCSACQQASYCRWV